MDIIKKLASTLGTRDESPNIQLAKEIVTSEDFNAVRDLVQHLTHGDQRVRQDCIKVLYEIGYIKPSLISTYAEHFLRLLASRNNRLQWGAMTALQTVTLEAPLFIYNNLPKILAAAEKGSVITRDNAFKILVSLGTIDKFRQDMLPLLYEQLNIAPANQLPMYAEAAFSVIARAESEKFVALLTDRMDPDMPTSKVKRLEKVIKKANLL